MMYHLFINGESVHSFTTFCQALAFCQYHNIHKGSIRCQGIILANIHQGETT